MLLFYSPLHGFPEFPSNQSAGCWSYTHGSIMEIYDELPISFDVPLAKIVASICIDSDLPHDRNIQIEHVETLQLPLSFSFEIINITARDVKDFL